MLIGIEGNPIDWLPAYVTAAGIIILAIGVRIKQKWLCQIATAICMIAWISSIYLLVS